MNITLTLIYLLSVRGYAHVDTFYLYSFLNITVALTYIHYLIDDLANMHTLKQFHVGTLFHMYDFDTMNS